MEQLTNFFRKTILPNFSNYMKNGSSSLLDYDDGELISNEDNQTSPVGESEHFSAQLSITEQVSNLSNATIIYGNHTTVDDYWKEDMKFVLDCLLLLLLILIMLAMGCEITVKSHTHGAPGKKFIRCGFPCKHLQNNRCYKFMEINEAIEKNVSDQIINDTTKFPNEILHLNDELKPVIDYLLLILLVLIMLSMGCEISLSQLWNHIRRPVGLSIGIVSQFGIKPLAAFAVLLAFGVEGLHATGVLIISCCPGGVLSNTFTYFSDGDLPLSVAMTTASTLMAMGMLPANIWLYGRYFESIELVIPYQKMALSLIIVTSPIAVGMLIKWKFPRIAKWTTKVGTYTGLLLMLACVIIEIIIFPDMFTSVPVKLYVIILALPGVGLALGYGIAALMKQDVPVCKTIAIECGVQNFPLALTVIALSFPMEMQGDIVLLPWLYGFAMIVGCSVLCGIYQLCKRYKERKIVEEKKVNGFKDGADDPEKEDLMHSNGVQIQMKQCKIKLNGTNTVSV